MDISSATVWAASFKVSIGTLEVDINALVAEITRSGFNKLLISAQHVAAARGLPAIGNVRTIAYSRRQALCELLGFLTHDGRLKGYLPLVEVV